MDILLNNIRSMREMDAKKLKNFNSNGYLIINDSETKRKALCLKKAIKKVMLRKLKTLKPDFSEKLDIDSIYNKLHTIDPFLSGGIYDVIRELPEFLDLININSLKVLLKNLFKWKQIHLPYGLCQFRIDRPGDTKYHFDWHQDYTFNIISKSAITFWVPLTDVTLEKGAVRILPGSHKKLLPVKGKACYEPGKNGNASSHLTFKLFNSKASDLEDSSISVPIKAGQILMFHSHVLHRSGYNQSNGLNRWVTIFRMGDLYDNDLILRNFFCARPNKPITMAGFSKIHPDYFISE